MTVLGPPRIKASAAASQRVSGRLLQKPLKGALRGLRLLLDWSPIALFSVVPLVWMVVSSFSTNSEIFGNSCRSLSGRSPLATSRLLAMRPWGLSASTRAVVNSLLVSFTVVLVGPLGQLTGRVCLRDVPLPRRRACCSGSSCWTMALPADVLAIPLYTVSTISAWSVPLPALIMPALGQRLRQSSLFVRAVLGIPRSLNRRARVDGLGWGRIYTKIAMPLSKGALIGAGLS